MFNLSKEKTELIKEKNVEELPPLLMKENKILQLLEKTEQKRLKLVNPFFDEHEVKLEDRTVTTLLNLTTDERERETLENEFVALTDLIIQLKNQEQLNNELIQQSMQLIQLSLNMINPKVQNMNYSRKNKNNQPESESSFDSKA